MAEKLTLFGGDAFRVLVEHEGHDVESPRASSAATTSRTSATVNSGGMHTRIQKNASHSDCRSTISDVLCRSAAEGVVQWKQLTGSGDGNVQSRLEMFEFLHNNVFVFPFSS